jgi:hypothetical protein
VLACTATALAIAVPGAASAHAQRFSIPGKKAVLKVGGKPQKRKFSFESARDDAITAQHDPRA